METFMICRMNYVERIVHKPCGHPEPYIIAFNLENIVALFSEVSKEFGLSSFGIELVVNFVSIWPKRMALIDFSWWVSMIGE